MAQPTKKAADKRSKVIFFRVTPQEARMIAAAAKRKDAKVGPYSRACVLAKSAPK